MKPIADYFKNARVGDRVEHLSGHLGTITKLWDCPNYPVEIIWDDEGKHSYTTDGRCTLGNFSQEVYYEGIRIIPPLEPKRKKKRWVNLYYADHNSKDCIEGFVYDDKKLADIASSSGINDRIACVEIEVEETRC